MPKRDTKNQNNGRKISRWYSWPVIVAFLILFLPVGIYLAYRRSNTVPGSGVGVLIAGVACFLLALLFYGAAEVGTGDYSFTITFIVSGLGLGYIGLSAIKMMKTFLVYHSWINNDGMTSLDEIASVTGKSYGQANKDLKKLIEKRYILDAYISDTKRELIYNDSSAGSAFDRKAEAKMQNAASTVVKCPNCGANNKVIIGSTGICEYCGAVIQ
jgi:hypothetical protein